MKNIWFGNKTYAALLAVLLIVLKLTALVPSRATSAPAQSGQEVWLNVFVHGIMSIKPHVSWNNFMLFVKDEIDGTLYEKTVELMREDPFFYKNQAMQRIGLHRVDPTNTTDNSSATLSYTMEEINKHYGLQKTSHYYTFGWSGLLSQKRRYQDGKDLFISLEKEIENVRKQYDNPNIKVRVIGYSHGGNVSLNLGLVHQKYFPKSTLSIDELVLLGTPVLTDTDYLINDPLFKKIFNLYSLSDRVQTLDFFAPKQFFSSRLFRSRKGFTLPKKLVQIQLKVTRCKDSTRRCPKKFELAKNLNKPSIVYGKKGLLRDVSPGHFELWFFGWTPVRYRDHYPLHPLPTVSLAPVITYHADKISSSLTPDQPVVADIRPEHNIILFRPKKDYRVHSTIPYLPPEKQEQLRRTILKHEPKLYTDEIYNDHIQDAVRNSRQIMEAYKKQPGISNLKTLLMTPKTPFP